MKTDFFCCSSLTLFLGKISCMIAVYLPAYFLLHFCESAHCSFSLAIYTKKCYNKLYFGLYCVAFGEDDTNNH